MRRLIFAVASVASLSLPMTAFAGHSNGGGGHHSSGGHSRGGGHYSSHHSSGGVGHYVARGHSVGGGHRGHHSHRRHFWHGIWYDYGIGPCWQYSDYYDEYIWVCD